MLKKKFLIVVLLGLIGGMIFLISNQSSKGTMTNVVQTTKKSLKKNFRFKTIENKIIDISVADKLFKIYGMEDKIVFLKIFGWDCKYCKREIPQLINLKKELGDTFEVIAIEAQEHTLEESKRYVKEYGINYHIILGDEQRDFYSYLQRKYGWGGIIPLTIVIAKGGKVLAFELGAKSYSLSELMKASLLRN